MGYVIYTGGVRPGVDATLSDGQHYFFAYNVSTQVPDADAPALLAEGFTAGDAPTAALAAPRAYSYRTPLLRDDGALVDPVTKALLAVVSDPPLARGPKSRTPQGVVFTSFQSGHGFFESGAGGVMVDDTSVALNGSQCLKVTTPGNGTVIYAKKNGISPTLDLTGKMVRVWARLPNPADILHINDLSIYLGNDSAMANSYAGFAYGSGLNDETLGEDGWVGFVVNFGDMGVTGSPNRAAISHIWLRAKDINGVAIQVQYGCIEFLPEVAAGVVSLTFDDGYLTQFTEARKKMSLNRYPGTAYTIRDSLVGESGNLDGTLGVGGGNGGYMSEAQLRELQDYHGWDIACHADTGDAHGAVATGGGEGFVRLSSSEIEAEFTNQQAWLRSHGFFGGAHTAYPHGRHDQRVTDLARKHFRSARSTYKFPICNNWPPTDAYKLTTISVNGDTTFATIQTEITRARLNKEWLVLCFHSIVTTPSPSNSSTQFPISVFGQIVDEVAAQIASTPTFAVRTVADVIENGM